MTNLVKMSFVDCKFNIENFQEYIINFLDELLKEKNVIMKL